MKLYLQFILRYFRYSRENSFSSNAINFAIIGLTIGVFSLLITLSVIKGFEDVLSKKLEYVDGQLRIKPIFGEQVSELISLDSIINKSKLEIDIQSFVRGSAIIYKNNSTIGILIEGIDSLKYYNELKIKNSVIEDNEIILGASLAKSLNIEPSEDVIIVGLNNFQGLPLNLHYNKVHFSETFKTGMGEYDKNLAYVNIKTAQKILRMNNKVNGYIVNSNSNTSLVLKYLKENIGYPYFIETWKDRHQIIFAWIKTQTMPIIIIFSLISLVGIINILATISLLINEKSKQIGILLSQGLEKKHVRNIFLLESGVIGFIGSISGFTIAYIFIFFQNKYDLITIPEEVYFMDSLPVKFDFQIGILIILLTFIISIFSAFLPTKTIFKINIPRIIEN